ncbi:hypothetical protein G7054_g11595 [Neopestalotiopsis clavispora]|nr:hypothetical protein G7054_g11595 [Neopestalotiopsis clavispora]
MLGRLKLKLSVTIETFREISRASFPNDRKKWTLLKKGIGGFLYDEEAFATEIRRVVRSHEANEDLALKETLEPKCRVIWEAARATSAAPLLFKPMILERPGVAQTMYDGALTDNNPIQKLMNECNRLDKDRKIGCVVSLGTGTKASKGLKGRDHVVKLMKLLAQQAINCDDKHLSFIESPEGQRLENEQRYFRFSVEKNLDEVEPDQWEEFDAIQEYVNHYLTLNRLRIENCAKQLLSSRKEAPLRPNLDVQRSVSAQPTLGQNTRNVERLLRDAQPSSISLPLSSAAIEPSHSIVPREDARSSEARVAAHNRTVSILSDSASIGQFSRLTLEGDPKEQISKEQIGT